MNEDMLSDEQRTWGMLCHLSALAGYVTGVGFIVGPLIVWLIKKDESSFINQQGKEALNFQISVMIYVIVASILCIVLIGFLLLPVIGIAHFVLTIIAGVKAKDGVMYRYPLTIRFVK